MTTPPEPVRPSEPGHLIERAARRTVQATDAVTASLANLHRADGSAQPTGRGALAQPAPPPLTVPKLVTDRTEIAVDAVTLQRAEMLDWRNSRDRLTEEFRIVQTQVLQTMVSVPAKAPAIPNMIMVTSARPGEGKTFSSLNLAGSIASCSHRQVILVDVDLQRHRMSSALLLKDRRGLLDCASDPAMDIASVVLSTALPDLHVLPVGQPDQVTERGGKPITTVLERIGQRFPECIIVLDAPPCLSSSEPSTLAPLVGQILMLVEAQQTQRAEVEAALDLVEACPSIMLLLNKVQITASDTFGAYGYY